jgi:hypothetical protein
MFPPHGPATNGTDKRDVSITEAGGLGGAKPTAALVFVDATSFRNGLEAQHTIAHVSALPRARSTKPGTSRLSLSTRRLWWQVKQMFSYKGIVTS